MPMDVETLACKLLSDRKFREQAVDIAWDQQSLDNTRRYTPLSIADRRERKGEVERDMRSLLTSLEAKGIVRKEDERYYMENLPEALLSNFHSGRCPLSEPYYIPGR